MTTINATRSNDRLPSSGEVGPGHFNWMGGISYSMSSALARLRMAAASSFFGEPQYYHSDGRAPRHSLRYQVTERELERLRRTLNGVDPATWRGLNSAGLMEKAIDEALEEDPEGTLQIAVALRNEDMIRVTPQVIMVRAAHHPRVRGTSLVRQYAPQIMKRADEPATQLAYHNAAYGKDKPLPNALKKAWRTYISGLNEYSLAKYRLESHIVKMVDVVNLCRPHSAAIDKLMTGKLTLQERTWESLISEKGSTKETWAEACERFLLNPKGHMALLRNLRNLHEVGLLDEKALNALLEGAPEGRQLPFRYYSAYRELEKVSANGNILDAIEACLTASLAKMPRFSGRVMSLSDNSGSAQGAMTSPMGKMQVSTIGNLTGILTGMAADEGWLGVFGDRLTRLAVRKGASVFDQLKNAEAAADHIGTRTENGIWTFFDEAIRNKEHWDHIFVYSDMQAGHGGLYGVNPYEYRAFEHPDKSRYIDVAKLVAAYREKVNPKAMVYLVQTAGYQDTLVPEFYDRTFILGGWGPGILKFAHAMQAVFDTK